MKIPARRVAEGLEMIRDAMTDLVDIGSLDDGEKVQEALAWIEEVIAAWERAEYLEQKKEDRRCLARIKDRERKRAERATTKAILDGLSTRPETNNG